MKRTIVVVLACLFFAACAWAQDAEAASSSSEKPLAPPAALAGKASPSAFASDEARLNLGEVGVAFTTIYNDNAQLTSTGEVGNTGYFGGTARLWSHGDN